MEELNTMPITTGQRQQIDAMIKERGCEDFKWIDPQKIGFPINVRTDYQQTMDRYAFFMVR